MDTQNAAWRDEAAKTSFGYKMMMKMGWSEGKGLGANEDGRTAHIKPEAKQDTRGIGSEVSTDNWLKNQKAFSSVLAGLKKAVGSDSAPAESSTAPLKHSAMERKLIKIRRKKGGRNHSTGFDNEVEESNLNSIFGKERQHLVDVEPDSAFLSKATRAEKKSSVRKSPRLAAAQSQDEVDDLELDSDKEERKKKKAAKKAKKAAEEDGEGGQKRKGIGDEEDEVKEAKKSKKSKKDKKAKD